MLKNLAIDYQKGESGAGASKRSGVGAVSGASQAEQVPVPWIWHSGTLWDMKHTGGGCATFWRHPLRPHFSVDVGTCATAYAHGAGEIGTVLLQCKL